MASKVTRIGWPALAGTALLLFFGTNPLARAAGTTYQDSLVEEAQSGQSFTREPAPEGKTIERIVIVPFDVIQQRDPWPGVLNWFHSTTEQDVVARELLFKEGDAWDPELIAESARNIRSYLFVSVAQIVPCQGSAPDKVVALVVTKDIWSLRLNSDFSFVGSKLENLTLQLTEANLLGRMKSVAGNFSMNLAAYSLGQQYTDTRVLGSRLALSERTDVIMNRATGENEGGIAALSLSSPLYSLDTQWGWQLSADYRKDISRLFINGGLAAYAANDDEIVPYMYRRRNFNAEAEVVRSFGRDFKQDVSGGWRAQSRVYALPSGLTGLSEDALAKFQANVIPRTEQAGLLFAGYRAYSTRFAPLIDVETFALTEDTRLGPDVYFELAQASSAFGFSSTYTEPTLSGRYTWVLNPSGDKGSDALDILSVTLTGMARRQEEVAEGTSWVNRTLSLRVRNVTPRLLGSRGFRLVTSLRLVRRAFDLDNSVETNGGDKTLRGFPSGYLRGSQAWAGNLEARSAPLAIYTTQIGAVAFVDGSDAFDSLKDVGGHFSAGIGARVLFPQFNRAVLRFDLAFPLEGLPKGYSPAYFTAQFDQAFF